MQAPATFRGWSRPERLAWKVPPRLKPSEWAEKFRRLTRAQSDRFGQWKNANAPYGVGIMDICTRPGVEEVAIQKAAQIGVSEFFRNVLGRWAHIDPDPVLFVMPDEKSGKKIVGKRLFPLFRTTPVLREQLTQSSRDLKLSQIVLANGFAMNLGWSGSPSTLASDPIRFVINDEVDKFQQWSGRESDPISLARVRTQTYGHRRFIASISTPTTRDGMITRLVEESDVILVYCVPCPHADCGKFAPMSFDRLKWDDFEETDAKKRAKLIEDTPGAAWYECPCCQQRIDDHHKQAMVAAGVWAPAEDAPDITIDRLNAAGHTGGGILPWLASFRRIGMKISCFPCLWIGFADIAAEFVRSVGDLMKMMNFRNSWLGETFEQQLERADVGLFSIKSRPPHCGTPPGILPRWTGKLLAFADTQHDHFKYVIRAFAAGYRSQRIDHGRAESFEELHERTLQTAFQFEEDRYPAIMPELLGIDIGGTRLAGEEVSRTEQVKQFAMLDPLRIRPFKGESEPMRGMPIRVSTLQVDKNNSSAQASQEFRHRLWLIDTNYFKDLLSAMLRQKIDHINLDTGELIAAAGDEGAASLWMLSELDDPEYNAEMASEHKIMIKAKGNKSGGGPQERWVPITASAANHYWDCEVGVLALAHLARVDLLPPAGMLDEQRQELLKADREPRKRFLMPDGRPFLITNRNR